MSKHMFSEYLSDQLTRKPGSLDEIRGVDVGIDDIAKGVTRIEMTGVSAKNFMSTLKEICEDQSPEGEDAENKDTEFVVEWGGFYFFVDTQGFSYPRCVGKARVRDGLFVPLN